MHAPRFGVGGIDDATRFVNCGEVTKRTGNVPHIVINGFRNSNNGKGMATLLAGLVQRVSAALGPISADAEKHVHVSEDQIFDSSIDVHRPPRGAEQRASVFVDLVDHRVGQHKGLEPPRWI